MNPNDEHRINRGLATDKVKGYQATIDSLEPDINAIDPSTFYASAAISLKRIADALEILVEKGKG